MQIGHTDRINCTNMYPGTILDNDKVIMRPCNFTKIYFNGDA